MCFGILTCPNWIGWGKRTNKFMGINVSCLSPRSDNAYDPDVGAKTLAVDVLEINNVKCLTFKDDGAGLDLDLLHKMLRYVAVS